MINVTTFKGRTVAVPSARSTRANRRPLFPGAYISHTTTAITAKTMPMIIRLLFSSTANTFNGPSPTSAKPRQPSTRSRTTIVMHLLSPIVPRHLIICQLKTPTHSPYAPFVGATIGRPHRTVHGSAASRPISPTFNHRSPRPLHKPKRPPHPTMRRPHEDHITDRGPPDPPASPAGPPHRAHQSPP